MKRVCSICLLVSSLVLLEFLIGCAGNNGKILPATTSAATSQASTAGTTPKTGGTLHSIYDGIYKGVFSYEYQQRSSLDENWSDVTAGWTQASFIITVTFHTKKVTEEYIELGITNVICSDVDFGTGLSGVTPPLDDDTWVYLPANPPTSLTNLSKEYIGITIKFPNYSLLQAPTVTSAGDSLPAFLSVSSAGEKLSNSLDSAIQNRTWLASTRSGVFQNPSGWGFYQHRFVSWYLTKVPD